MSTPEEIIKPLLEKCPPELIDFALAMNNKRELRRKTNPERPPDPWNQYPSEFIQARLKQEFNEWKTATLEGTPEDEADECVDVANFAMFRWTQIMIRKNGK